MQVATYEYWYNIGTFERDGKSGFMLTCYKASQTISRKFYPAYESDAEDDTGLSAAYIDAAADAMQFLNDNGVF